MAKPRKFKKAGAPVPRWMLETRTDAWSEAGISDEIRLPHRGPAWPQLILFAVLIGWLIFGERMTGEKALASIIIVAGVMLTRL